MDRLKFQVLLNLILINNDGVAALTYIEGLESIYLW